MNTSDTCRLCREQADLCNSHIIPEFFYKPIYDDAHRTGVISSSTLRIPVIQKGLRERLLCASCEARLQKWEDYVARAWNRGDLLPARLPAGTHTTKELDYTKLKLCLLSILWRCDAASHDAFSQVDLGSHEETIRSHLLSGEAPPRDEYAIFGAAIVWPEDRSPLEMIVSPSLSELEGQPLCHMAFGGISWQFVISHEMPDVLDMTCLREDGTITFTVWSAEDYVPGRRFAEKRRQLESQMSSGLEQP